MKTKIEFSDEELELLRDGDLDKKLDLYRKMLTITIFSYHRFKNEVDARFYDYHRVAELRHKITLIKQLKSKLDRAEKENK